MAEAVTEKVAEISLKEESGEAIYTSDARGSDESGEGSYKVPYKTVLQAMRRCGKEPFPGTWPISSLDLTAVCLLFQEMTAVC